MAWNLEILKINNQSFGKLKEIAFQNKENNYDTKKKNQNFLLTVL